jgi:uncharacterized protein
MIEAPLYKIKKYDFNKDIFNEFQNNEYINDLWPIVYILSNGKIKGAYVGETTDAYSRMGNHLKSDSKSKLTAIHLITSKKFNKSATLDIESNLIKYISGDGQYKLLNANIGLANHTYYQKKEVYWDVFKDIWNELKAEGITKNTLEHINNSDLFKYSPYKSLSIEQKEGLIDILKSLLDTSKSVIIEGGAGTGKTILAIFLFKLLNTDIKEFNFKEFGDEETELVDLVTKVQSKYPEPTMALIVPMSSFRKTLKNVFKNIKGLNPKMVIGPAELANSTYDILVVDESHRLRKRVNLGAYFKSFDIASKKLKFDKNKNDELDWVLQQGNKHLFFYDENQSIKPSDVNKENFDRLKSEKGTIIRTLKSQFRSQGGNGYVKYVHGLLDSKLKPNVGKYSNEKYEFLLFDSLEKMIERIKFREAESGLSRLVAGYSWPWISKKNKKKFDIQIGDIALQWNNASIDWINTKNSINEVGCIHTTQGYDLNYAGVIFGNEISYDKEKREIVIDKNQYFDKAGKQTIKDPEELKQFIVNIYKTIMLRGIKGTYIYVCNDNLREYFRTFIPEFEIETGLRKLPSDKVDYFVNSVPLYNIKVAAGTFSELQSVEDFDWVELPKPYTAKDDYFVCQVIGESMNKKIPNNSWCLFKKDSGGSREGKIVLVEHRNIRDVDFGAGYTVKRYRSEKIYNQDGTWSHDTIILKPESLDTSYSEIVLKEDELTELKVIGIFEAVIG